MTAQHAEAVAGVRVHAFLPAFIPGRYQSDADARVLVARVLRATSWQKIALADLQTLLEIYARPAPPRMELIQDPRVCTCGKGHHTAAIMRCWKALMIVNGIHLHGPGTKERVKQTTLHPRTGSIRLAVAAVLALHCTHQTHDFARQQCLVVLPHAAASST